VLFLSRIGKKRRERNVMPITAKLPPDRISVRDGKVVKSEHWMLLNEKPWLTLSVERTPHGFAATFGSPGGGKAVKRGSLEQILAGLHPNVQAWYKKLFSLERASAEAIRRAGFTKDEIEFLF
jgi:hypothetical protein